MPGVAQLSVDQVVRAARETHAAGVPATILFGIPQRKDAHGTEAWNDQGEVQRAVREIKERVPGLAVITDVCLCEYTDHGHCGVVDGRRDVDNDATLELLARCGVSPCAAGADMVAPSDMMDGRVGAIRARARRRGFVQIADHGVLGQVSPRRSTGRSARPPSRAPQFGDRRATRWTRANGDEAMREVALDLAEGADIVMVKPALAVSRRHPPGQAMSSRAGGGLQRQRRVRDGQGGGANGWLDEERVVMEILTGIKRAGADMILSYFATEVAKRLK